MYQAKQIVKTVLLILEAGERIKFGWREYGRNPMILNGTAIVPKQASI